MSENQHDIKSHQTQLNCVSKTCVCGTHNMQICHREVPYVFISMNNSDLVQHIAIFNGVKKMRYSLRSIVSGFIMQLPCLAEILALSIPFNPLRRDELFQEPSSEKIHLCSLRLKEGSLLAKAKVCNFTGCSHRSFLDGFQPDALR